MRSLTIAVFSVRSRRSTTDCTSPPSMSRSRWTSGSVVLRNRSSYAFSGDSHTPRTVTASALMAPLFVVVSSVTSSPGWTPKARARPMPVTMPRGGRLARSSPSTMIENEDSSDSPSGSTPTPTNEVVVSPVETSPEHPRRAVTVFTWGIRASSARRVG